MYAPTSLPDPASSMGNPHCLIGRRPAGFTAAGPAHAETPLGHYFAELAELEAASIPAFQRLADELVHHDAPEDLVARAQSAARDEAIHHEWMTELARRFGAEPSAPAVPPLAPRTLFEVALENAVEGCVRETFGALKAVYQSEHASDPSIRAVMKRIAEDEVRHGALAWNIATWIDGRLSEVERAKIEEARAAAIHALQQSSPDPHPDVARIAGAPTAAQCSSFLRDVWGELWASSWLRATRVIV